MILCVRFPLNVSSVVKLYQTLKTVLDNIPKHREVPQKYSATRLILNSLLSMFGNVVKHGL